MDRYEIIITGFGGQGVVLGGIILADAAAIYDDINAIHNQSYGPEARGGASKSEVIISKGAIHFPEIEHPDIMVALTQEAANKYAMDLKENGLLLLDSRIKDVKTPAGVKVITLPIIDTAANELGSELVTNIVTLGALVAATKVVSVEALEKAVLARVPKGTEELNLKAMKRGIEIAG